MQRSWIVIGDITSSGGRVITGSGFTDIEGKGVAREGDMATCPIHNGAFPISSGCDATTIVDGRAVALHGAKLACGCGVLAVQQRRVFVDYRSDASVAAGSVSTVAAVSASGTDEAQFDEQFRLVADDDGPLSGRRYRIVASDGSIWAGTSDADGLTERISTPQGVELTIEILPLDDRDMIE